MFVKRGKFIKPMPACTFRFIFYFNILMSHNFYYSDFSLLINNAIGRSHSKHQPCCRINGV